MTQNGARLRLAALATSWAGAARWENERTSKLGWVGPLGARWGCPVSRRCPWPGLTSPAAPFAGSEVGKRTPRHTGAAPGPGRGQEGRARPAGGLQERWVRLGLSGRGAATISSGSGGGMCVRAVGVAGGALPLAVPSQNSLQSLPTPPSATQQSPAHFSVAFDQHPPASPTCPPARLQRRT